MKRTALIFICVSFLLVACKEEKNGKDLYQEVGLTPVKLSNGWTLSPMGAQQPLGDLPLNMILSPDSSLLAIVNNGVSEQSVQLYDVRTGKVTDTKRLNRSWVGLCFSENGKSLMVSGGNDNCVWMYGCEGGTLTLEDSVKFGKPWPEDTLSITGIAVRGMNLYAVTKDSKDLWVYDLIEKRVQKRLSLPAEAYDCKLSPERNELYISLWGAKEIAVYNLDDEKITHRIAVGSHPNDMAFHPDGERLFVANANDNSVSVIDIKEKKVIENLSCSLYPDAPAGSTTNAVCVSEDGEFLLVANADNNCLLVFEVEEKGESRAIGYLPTGWYPTAVEMVGHQIFVTNGKGDHSQANPKGPNPGQRRGPETEYIGSLFKGSLSSFEMPSEERLKDYAAIVLENTPYSKEKEIDANGPEDNPIPSKVGDSSPIKYVFYVIKENRTYDQVLGDCELGNGDPALCLFPDSVSPNQHKLANEFVLFDNFYVDAEVSADGHNWSTASYANDYTEKTWPTLYGRRGGQYDYEGTREIAWPDQGFIWDYCERAGIPFRSYGEFVWGDTSYYESVSKNYDTRFPSYNLGILDTVRFKRWKQDFDSLLAINKVPRFNSIRFGNDHTAGARDGYPTPAAMVADNDLAVGMLVDHISHSPIWKESAIFILEDDAQNGPDHVDAHRSILFVASPYTKRKTVDHTMYSTSSVLRSMELILGLPPMSQYDAAATPLYAAFDPEINLDPFDHVANRIPLDQMNAAPQALVKETLEWRMDKEDAAPDIPFNRNIWRTVRGMDAEMPAPKRAAFIFAAEEEEEDD
ncbi:MAG: bifunctional YncE family protein/alkaline phosphatase family protein [Bacteroidota bacterium]